MGVVAAVVLIVGLFAVGFALKAWVDARGRAKAGAVGDRLMSGKAAKHVALLEPTLLVRAAPATVTELVAPVLADHSRWVLFDPADPQAGEHAAWASTSSLTPALPRLAVRPSTTPGWSEFGVVAYAWRSRFPQGGGFAKRVTPRCREALRSADLEVREVRREFTVPLTGPTSDGVRTALPLSAAAGGAGGTALDAS
ncbi:hypothetical protein [Jatrophihabitans fulvus]